MSRCLLLLVLVLNHTFNVTGNCSSDEFQCGDKTCITLDFRCDTFADCRDGSDEIGCHVTSCRPDEFLCNDGTCITNAFRCDGFPDCKDNADEVGCASFDKCKDGCKEPILIYEDLGCKPIFDSPKGCCPTGFNCSHIEDRAASCDENCYFHGKSYKEGEYISDYETDGSCQFGCVCKKTRTGRMKFFCSHFACPEWIGKSPKPGCYFKYRHNKCCTFDQVCPPFRAVCKVGSKTYYEGQRFEAPEAKCKTCICQNGFDNKYGPPFCRKFQCITEIMHQIGVQDFCAPSYLSLDDCCPINWICPAENDTIIENPRKQSNHECYFGEDFLNIGDRFERVHNETGARVVCQCRVPPYLTCLQDYKYPTY